MKRMLMAFAIIPSVLAVPSAAGQEFTELPRPKGPDANELAIRAWDDFDDGLPPWFRAQIKYKRKFEWRDPQEMTGFYPDELAVIEDEVLSRKDGKCWVEDRVRISGYRTTVKYGFRDVRFTVNAGARAKLTKIYLNAVELKEKESLAQVVGSQDKSCLQFLGEQIPVAGEVLDKGTAILGTGDTIEKMGELQKGLERFIKEYRWAESKIGKVVRTITANFDNAVFVRARRVIRDLRGTKREVTCEGGVWDALEEGEARVFEKSEFPLKGDFKVLSELFAKPNPAEDLDKLLIRLRGTLAVWNGFWNTQRSPVFILSTSGPVQVIAKPGSSLARQGSSIQVTFASPTILRGRWSTTTPEEKGTFTWTMKPGNPKFTGTYSNVPGGEENIPWCGWR